jgi:hypothetical protein
MRTGIALVTLGAIALGAIGPVAVGDAAGTAVERAPGAAAAVPRPVRARTTEALAGELRRLRARQARPGSGDREGRAWNGRMHQVMAELVVRLGTAGTRRSRIAAVMGAPDARVGPGDERWRLVPEEERGAAEELLCYRWRGWHDFAWFGLAGGVVVSRGWWLAGE